MHVFELAVQSWLYLEPGHTVVLTLKFLPLKLEPRHCAIVLKNKELGDIILSVYATVKHPKPIVPECKCLNSSTVVNTQTRTLHLKAHAGQRMDEEIIIHSNNVAFENAMLEISKWDMSSVELKRRILSKSLKYAALSTAIDTLGMDEESKEHKHQLLEGCERIVFSVEGSDTKHFQFPKEVSLSASNKGKVGSIVFF